MRSTGEHVTVAPCYLPVPTTLVIPPGAQEKLPEKQSRLQATQ